MKKILLILSVLAAIGCSSQQPAEPTAPVATVTAEPKPEAPKVIWRHPAEAMADMEDNCFVVKFYSVDDHENKLLDKLLNDPKISSKIRSSYVPVYWDDNFKDRNELKIGIDEQFAGLMIAPLEEAGVIVEVETLSDDEFTLSPDAVKVVYGFLNGYKCP